jgi:N-acetylmuramoyl-L-alanine amidase
MLVAVAVAMVMAPPVWAEHGPVYDVSCSTGTAEIVLDPGHGGPDPGAVNEKFGIHEADLNLEIAKRTATILQDEHGFTVALTRDDNETELGNSERGAIANACQALVFVEIHLNASTDHSVNYAQAFWAEKEKDIALSLVMTDALGTLGIPVYAVDRFDNGGLLRAKMPSVLVEAVFLSNDEEAKSLADGTRQESIAKAVAAGVASWLALGNATDRFDGGDAVEAGAFADAGFLPIDDGAVRQAEGHRQERLEWRAYGDPLGIRASAARWNSHAAQREVTHA